MKGLAAYSSVQDQDADTLVNLHAPLVKRIAYHMVNRLPPSVQVDDLIQAGMIGLLEASRNYDQSRGASFETYAGIRIRGSMLDEIRRSDWTPRSVHRKARMVSDAMRDIENEQGRDARDVEVADAMGLTLESYHKILLDSSGCRVFSVEELRFVGELPQVESDCSTIGPLDGFQKNEFKDSLAEAISGLPERERLVIALYYDEEMNLREIGQVLGVTESRACQIHGQATFRLRSRLTEWLSENEGQS
ncbi:MAG: RNA polymerase sigma factor FliA [Gammaproteobacteria bacterium]|nr:RNA polymerase sigma factor FliA [Gammaproteobacteria bacterium]